MPGPHYPARREPRLSLDRRAAAKARVDVLRRTLAEHDTVTVMETPWQAMARRRREAAVE